MKRTKFYICIVCGIGVLFFLAVQFSGRRGPRDPQQSRIRVEMKQLSAALQQYHLAYAQFPEGNNSQISKMLLGNNPRKISFFSFRKGGINFDGDAIDPWGTPYNFQIGGTNAFQIMSAGKNKIFGDKDDLLFPIHKYSW